MVLIAVIMTTISTFAQLYIYFNDGTVVKVDSISLVVPNEPEKPDPSEGIGVFSVSATKQVAFSRGNLQYTKSTNTWSFASTQYEMLGTDNVIGGTISYYPSDGYGKEGNALADKIDLFGWSTSDTYFGTTVIDPDEYEFLYTNFIDWGNNKIGNDAPNTWRTLTYDEWYYLRHRRNNANSLCGIAQVNGVNGLILLPDNWTCPAGITFKSGFSSEWKEEAYGGYQSFSADQWSKLETTGAVFLPSSGARELFDVYFVQLDGLYCSASIVDGEHYAFDFNSSEARMDDSDIIIGASVRLVKDL